MQFVEPSMLGVRSARISLISATSPVRITLLPMVHVGEGHFYETTYNDAKSHDVVLLEGVRSPITKRITRSYRWLVGSRRMAGLVVQPSFVAASAKVDVIHADLTAEEFESEWRRVPIWIRAAIYVLAPLLGLRRRWLYSKAKLAKDMRCEDQPSLAELMAMTPETGALTQAILHARDSRLLERLGDAISRTGTNPESIAIIYGVAHMRAVVRELMIKRDFVIAATDWRTILSLD